MSGKPKDAKAEPKGAAKGVNWSERLKSLDADVDTWVDRAEWARRMAAKGFMPKVQADIDTKRLEDARAALKKAQEEYKKLVGEEKEEKK